MLVVIAIIAILAALLLPALQGARQSARNAVCLSNLHQIAVALEGYRGDNGRFPPTWDFGLHPHLGTWLDFLLGDECDRVNDFRVRGYNNQTYIDDEDLYMCPADKPHPSQVNEDRGSAWGFVFDHSYGGAVPALQPSDAGPGPYEAYEASKQVLASDGHWIWMQNFSHQYVYGEAWNNPNWWASTVSFRHKMGSTGNFVMWGGNTRSRKYIQMEDYRGPTRRNQFESTSIRSTSTESIFFYQAGEHPLEWFY